MKTIAKSEEKSTSATCPDCKDPVDLSGPCWIRVSPRPERTQAWHLRCRDRYLAELSKAAFKANEEREQFRASLEMLGRISVAAASAGDTITDGEALAIIRDLVGGGK